MRLVSDNVRDCDRKGIRCIDYVSEFVSEAGALEQIESMDIGSLIKEM